MPASGGSRLLENSYTFVFLVLKLLHAGSNLPGDRHWVLKTDEKPPIIFANPALFAISGYFAWCFHLFQKELAPGVDGI